MKKKLLYILCTVFVAVICGISGCSYSENGQSIPANSAGSDALEATYYDRIQKLDKSYLYIPEERDFCIQLPEDADLVNNIEEYGGRLSCISSLGHLGVHLDETRLYKTISESELKDNYAAMFYGETEDYKITDFQILTNEQGDEIGRSYTVTNDKDEAVIYLRELKYNDNVMNVIGQPAEDDAETIKAFVDSFMLI